MSDDGPVDLRLVPAAAAAWLVSGMGVAVAPGWLAAAAAGLAACLVGLVALRAVGAARYPSPGSAGRPRRRRWSVSRLLSGATARPGEVASEGSAWGSAALLLAVVLAVLVCCAIQVAVRGGGVLAEAVQSRSVVTVVGTVRAEVTRDNPSWAGTEGARGQPSATFRTILAVELVHSHGGTSTAAAPVVVTGGREWSTVPFGARVRVNGRLAPMPRGDPVEAELQTWGAVDVLSPPGPVDAAVNGLRSGLLRSSEHLPPDARGLVPGAAIGDVSRVPDDLTAAMRAVGLTHVTAVSGSHFALLAGAVLSLTGALRLSRTSRALITAATIGGLVLLVHPQPSVVRAAVMGVVGCLGLVLGRRSSAVAGLCVAVILLLLVDPWLARSLGFVLSVSATAAIVILGPRLADAFSRCMPGWLADGLAVPVAAQVVCAPVVVLLTPAVSVYAVPANLLAAPALVPATLLGVAATLVAGWWPMAGRLLCEGAGAASWWVAAVARTGAAMPGATLPWRDDICGAVALLAVDAAVVVALLGARRLRREGRLGILALTLLVAVLLLPEERSMVVTLLTRV